MAASAGAEAAPPTASCGAGATGHALALPSGGTETLCYADSTVPAPAAGPHATDPAAALTFAKTVGTDANACASSNTLQVLANTQVFYCYTVTNTGGVTLTAHTLTDDHLGTLLSNYAYDLGPGQTKFVTASAMISADTVNLATWSAVDGAASPTASDMATGTSSASVTVLVSGTAPDAPSITGASPAEGQATVSWDPPANDGGATITGYVVTPYIGAVAGTPVDLPASARTTTIDGLLNGTTYTLHVAATNSLGTSADAISDPVTPQWWLPWSSGPEAVKELFTWFTGVAPTTAESTSWLAQLDAGTKLPGDLVAALRVGTDGTKNVDPTVRLYSAYLVRIPDASGLKFWLGRRRSGWTLSRISNYFAHSHEFINRYGALTNEQFVNQIYVNVLGRTGEQSGVDYWTAQLDQHKKSRGQVMINFSESHEYVTKQVNPVNAAVIYIFLRGRTPTVAERDAFVAELVASTPLATAVREQIHLPDFATRAG